MSTEILQVRVDSEKIEHLDQIAKHESISREELINQAIDQRLELDKWRIKRVMKGIEDADAGRFASDAEIERVLRKYENA